MKMKLWKRISIMLFSVMTLALLGLFALEVFGCGYGERVAKLITDTEGNYIAQWLALTLAGFAVIAVLCVLMFLMAARDGRIKAARMIKLVDEGGDHVLLVQETLDALVERSLGKPIGVSDIKIVSAYADEQLVIMIDVAVDSNINIPETTRDMQQNVRTQIAQISGIKVSDVSIRISTIKIPDGYDSTMRGAKGAEDAGAPTQPQSAGEDAERSEYAFEQREDKPNTQAPEAETVEAPEAEPDNIPETEPDSAPEAEPEYAPEAEPEYAPESEPESAPDDIAPEQAPAFDFGIDQDIPPADAPDEEPATETEPDELFGAQGDITEDNGGEPNNA